MNVEGVRALAAAATATATVAGALSCRNDEMRSQLENERFNNQQLQIDLERCRTSNQREARDTDEKHRVRERVCAAHFVAAATVALQKCLCFRIYANI